MKIKISSYLFLKAAEKVNIFSDSIVPGIMIEATGGNLIFTASNLDSEVSVLISEEDRLTVTGEGVIRIPGKAVIDLVKNLIGDITIETDKKGKGISIRSGKSKYTFHTIEVEFPHLTVDGKAKWKTDLREYDFNALINSVAFAALKETTKRNLNGVYIEPEADGLRATATDAHRLAINSMEANTTGAGKAKQGVIIPLKSLNNLIKFMSPATTVSSIRIAVHEKVVVFETDLGTVITRTIDENYPDCKSLTNIKADVSIVIHTNPLKDAFDRLQTVVKGKCRCVALTVKENKVNLVSADAAIGTGAESVEAVVKGTLKDGIYLNAKYITDFLEKMVNVDTVTINISDRAKITADFEGTGKEYYIFSNVEYIVMPIRHDSNTAASTAEEAEEGDEE